MDYTMFETDRFLRSRTPTPQEPFTEGECEAPPTSRGESPPFARNDSAGAAQPGAAHTAGAAHAPQGPASEPAGQAKGKGKAKGKAKYPPKCRCDPYAPTVEEPPNDDKAAELMCAEKTHNKEEMKAERDKERQRNKQYISDNCVKFRKCSVCHQWAMSKGNGNGLEYGQYNDLAAIRRGFKTNIRNGESITCVD